ncbi:hypothetical protein TELCIR_15121, partial [Teladorsagia circumcincta]
RFEARGVKVYVNAEAERLEGEDEVTGVHLKSGETIPADVVVTGIGVAPPTDWLKSTRIKLNDAGFIEVDRHFRTSVDWVYAIGDAVAAPLPLQGIVVAVASAGPIPTAVQFLELFKRKIEITREDVEKNTTNDWLAWLE